MKNNSFFYFLTLNLLKEKRRYAGIVIISSLLIFLLSSVLFISSSIKQTLNYTLKAQPDFIVQNIKGGKVAPINSNMVDKILNIYGVEKVTKRVYGRYFFDDKYSTLIVGIDFLDEQSNKNLETLINSTDLKQFLSKEQMIIGQGVKNYLKTHYYNLGYNFLTPDGEMKNIKIFKTLSSKSAIISNDETIMPLKSAQKVLGLKENEITDIALNVPNDSEWQTVKAKLQSLNFNIRVISKKDMQKAYESLFNYKGGLFLVLFLIVIATFSLLLYLRYTLAASLERKEIAILRAVGWSIKDVLKLKFLENIFLVIFAFILGSSLAYIFVFILNAPLLKNIFLGGSNLTNFAKFTPVVDYGVLSTIFIIFTVAFLSSVLIPVWKIAVTEPKEAL